ncbi:MAG TPA: hypothetical protein VEM40_04410 [Nitrospirota bacterium]|nr:hypothetical protein [Nitrospirota bacterium]
MTEQEIYKKKRILLGQLGKLGDCLYATVIARQIKKDNPGCHLTWAISSVCRSVIEGNPDVDEIWELRLKTYEEVVSAWQQFEMDARVRKERGEYDEIYLTQVDPDNYQNFDGTVRASIYRGYPKPIEVSMQPIVRLSESEIAKVRRFAESNDLISKNNVVLFECGAASGQSYVDHEFALKVVEKIVNNRKDTAFVLSSNKSITVSDNRVIDGSVLTFKENAELTKYCTLLVGCSSGISWLATSDWAKPLPKIQLLSADKKMYASMIHDAKYCGFSMDQILEMQDCSPDQVASCIQTVIDNGFATAKKIYHEDIPVDFQFYFKTLFYTTLNRNQMGKAARSLKVTMDRFANNIQLSYFQKNLLLPYYNLIWSHIPTEEKDAIIKNLNHDFAVGRPTKLRQIYNAIKIIQALSRKDTHWMAKMLLKNLAYKMLYN